MGVAAIAQGFFVLLFVVFVVDRSRSMSIADMENLRRRTARGAG